MTKTLESKTLRYNAGDELAYRKELSAISRAMVKEVSEKIIETYRNDKSLVSFATDSLANDIGEELKKLQKKYEKLFTRQGEEAAKRMVMRQLRYSRTAFAKAMEKIIPIEKDDIRTVSIKGSVIPREMQETIKASIMENVSLIKSIPSQYFERVTGSVTRSMQSGGSIKQLRAEIMKYNGMTTRRANIIANDQVKKTFMSINLRNFQQAGIKKAKWIHSGGGQNPREYHYRRWDGVSHNPPNGLNGYIFDIDNPPIIQFAKGSQQEVRGYPAQLPNCKCVMAAVVELEGI